MQLFGGYWLPAQAIAVLETGMLLDQDPLTGVETRVVRANGQQVVLQAAGQGHLTQLFYNARDGRLTALDMAQQSIIGTIHTSLELTP
jgi:hypothetical protein